MIYFAHRGANTKRVQNTVDAFALAHRQGARHFELDVHLLKDGALAVHHDYSLLATAGKDILLKDVTSKDLKNIPLKNPFTKEPVYVPLLSEVLPVLTEGLALLNIEIKNDEDIYPGIEEKLLGALPADLLPKVLFSSFDRGTLERISQLAPQARRGQLTRNFNVQEALALGVESVHINQTRFTPQIARACRQYHLYVYCYTVNDPQQAAQLAAQGVDGIFTDDTTLFEH